jgi:hypothetical protein
MSSNTALNAINPHAYGLKAAAACDAVINQILVSTESTDLIKSIDFINNQNPATRADLMQALIQFSATGDRDAAAQIIKGYEYLAAHLHLGKHMHALAMINEMNLSADYPAPVIPEISIYPARDENYEPAVTCITEILCETIQASNAPSAAIPAATRSI